MSVTAPVSAATQPAIDPDRRRLVYATTIVISILWIVLDQATKIAAVRLYENQLPDDLGPVILRVIRNEGGAFSLPIKLPWIFVLVAIVVTVLVARALPQTRSLGLASAYGLVVGGAIGNGADRIFRDGAVVDMIDLDFAPLSNFPVFNVADVGITVGAVLVALLMMAEDRRLARMEEPAVLHPLAGSAAPHTPAHPPQPALQDSPDDRSDDVEVETTANAADVEVDPGDDITSR